MLPSFLKELSDKASNSPLCSELKAAAQIIEFSNCLADFHTDISSSYPESGFPGNNRDSSGIQIFNPDKGPALNSKDDLVDLRFVSLYFHGYGTIPIIFHPSGYTIKTCRMHGTVTKPYTLYRAVEGNMPPNHIHRSLRIKSVSPGFRPNSIRFTFG